MRFGLTRAWALVVVVWLPLLGMALDGARPRSLRRFDAEATVYRPLLGIWSEPRLFEALERSLVIAFAAAILATGIVALNLAILRLRRGPGGAGRVDRWFRTVSFGGLFAPELVIGLGVGIVLGLMGLGRSLGGLVYAHSLLGVLVGMPLALSLSERMPLSPEWAAGDCGATAYRVALQITLPAHRHILAVVFLVSFTLSFEDFIIALFVAPYGAQTLPLLVYSLIKFQRLGDASALGTLLAIAACAAAIAISRLGQLQTILAHSRFKGGQHE